MTGPVQKIRGIARQSMRTRSCHLLIAFIVAAAGCSSTESESVSHMTQEPAEADRAPPPSTQSPAISDPSFWDRIAADYEAKAHPFARLYAEAMLAGLNVGPGTRLLDVATGTGAAALPAAELGADVVAIDFSAEMIRRLRANHVPNIDARQMDGQALDLPDASFDISVSVFGVMVFPDWNQGLREMARVTRPGGVGAVVTWRDPNGAGINQIVGSIIHDLFPDVVLPPPPPGMVALSDPDRLADAMVAAGFATPLVQVLTQRYTFEIDEVFAANPWSRLLTDEQQRRVLDEIERRFQGSREDRRFFVETDALFVRAVRPG